MVTPLLMNKWLRLFTGLCVAAFVSAPLFVFAEEVRVPLEVGIGKRLFIAGQGSTTEILVDYVAVVYEFIVAAVGIVAAVAIMYWGFRWITAAGNQTVIGSAKEGIVSALIGLVLSLASYAVLVFINPGFVSLQSSDVPGLELVEYLDEGESIAAAVSPGDCSAVLNSPASSSTCTGLSDLNAEYTLQALNTTALQMLPAPAAQWDAMAEAYFTLYGTQIPITHSFRSIEYQQCLVDEARGDHPAAACTSPHNGGAAVDVNTLGITQAQYNWIVCGQEETCETETLSSGTCGSVERPANAHYGFKVFNYNENRAEQSLCEQHHFDFQNSTSSSTEVCIACPGLTACGCE